MKKVSKYYRIVSKLLIVIFVSILAVETLWAETRYKVKSTDNLNNIIKQFYPDSSLSNKQIKSAILAKNPRAFKRGNINFLLRGKRLILPDESDIELVPFKSDQDLLTEYAQFTQNDSNSNSDEATSEKKVDEVEKFDESEESDAIKRLDPSDKLLRKQKEQTKKINQLQKESNTLKNKLQALVNEKKSRDQRLSELETSLKETRGNLNKRVGTNKITKAVPVSEKQIGEPVTKSISNNNQAELIVRELEKNKNAQKQGTPEEINKPVEITDVSKDKPLEEKADESQAALTNQVQEPIEHSSILPDENIVNKVPSSIANEDKLLTYLVWLIPLLILIGFLFLLLRKRKSRNSYQDETSYLQANEDINNDFEEDSLETSIKLDVARAYIEAEDTESALDILSEIMEEGNAQQRKQAHELLENISPS